MLQSGISKAPDKEINSQTDAILTGTYFWTPTQHNFHTKRICSSWPLYVSQTLQQKPKKNAKRNDKIFKHLSGKNRIFQTQLDFAFLRTCVCSFPILLKTYVFHFFLFCLFYVYSVFSADRVKLQNGNSHFWMAAFLKFLNQF